MMMNYYILNMEERIRTLQTGYERDELPFHKQLKENGLTLDDLELEEVKINITDDYELKNLEGDCQRLYKPQCNVRIEGRSREEYYEDNKEMIARNNMR